MPSIFNARDADSYEQMMGRWSRRLAPLFIEHAGVAAGERLLEVGCALSPPRRRRVEGATGPIVTPRR